MPKFNSFVYDVATVYTPNIIKKDCLVYFRPSPEYKEKGTPFGFDWVRTGDATDYVAHDIPYKDIVGRHYNRQGDLAERGTNTESNFVPDEEMYKALCRSYLPDEIIIFPSSKGCIEKYHTPVMTIYPNNVATPAKLVLEINISKPAQQIYLKYDENLFTINGADSLPCEVGKHLCDIEIICTKAFKRDLYIYAVSKESDSDENMVGLIRVWRNDKAYRKSINVLLVNFKFLISDDVDAIPLEGNVELVKESLNRYLAHALITPVFEEVELDLGYDVEIRKRIIRHNGIDSLITFEQAETLGVIDPDSILPLDAVLGLYYIDTNMNTSSYHVIIICFGCGLCMLGMDGGIAEQNGYSCGKYVCIDKDSGIDVPTHEVLHSLGLVHTFENYNHNNSVSRFTYRYGHTDNIMDYCHLKGIKPVSLWQWQWVRARMRAAPEK